MIDDARISIVLDALKSGVELEGNALYYELLNEYSHFQKIRSDRIKAINFVKKQQQAIKKGETFQGLTPKYKFEQPYFDRKKAAHLA